MISTEEDFQAIMDENFETTSNPSDSVDSTVQVEEQVCDSQPIEQTNEEVVPSESTQIIIEDETAICSICDSAVFDAVVCSTCYRIVHGECCIVGECHLCAFTTRRNVKRKAVHQAHEKQAKKMVEDDQTSLEPLDIGDNVRYQFLLLIVASLIQSILLELY